MGIEDRKLAINAGVWLGNVVTSVAIIFLTKCAGLHFLSCAFAIWSAKVGGFIEPPPSIPFKYKLLFSIVGSISIASANFSLLLNSVGFYQIAKLTLAPFVCAVEIIWIGKRFSVPVLMSIAMVLVGVGIVTVSDVAIKPLGFIMAVIFVITSGLQQILCGHFQSKFSISAHQLLANTSPLQGSILLLSGPFVDYMVTGQWIQNWEVSVPGLEIQNWDASVPGLEVDTRVM
eukprot:gene6665-3330_t